MRNLIILVAILAGTLSAYGQKLKLGVFVDPQISWVNLDSRNTESTGVKMALDGGLFIDNYFQKNYALQTGVSLGNYGCGIKLGEDKAFTSYGEDTVIVAGTDVDFRLRYITIPVGLKLKTNAIGYFSYFARIGFSNQFNIDGRATSSDGVLKDSNIKDEIFIYNLGYYFGLGFHYNISEDTALVLGLNYNNGFIDFLTDNSMKAYTRSVSLRLGILF